MAIEQLAVFKTSDGQVFDNAEAAQAHEASLEHAAAIEAFLDKHFPKPEKKQEVKDGVPVTNEDGTPKMVQPQAQGRTYARKAVTLWLAEAA